MLLFMFFPLLTLPGPADLLVLWTFGFQAAPVEFSLTDSSVAVQEVTLKGKIHLEDGNVVPGASVKLYAFHKPTDYTVFPYTMDLLGETVSDPNGSYSFALSDEGFASGSILVVGSIQGYAPGWQMLESVYGAEHNPLYLEKAAAVSGGVQNEKGAPVSDAIVYVLPMIDPLIAARRGDFYYDSAHAAVAARAVASLRLFQTETDSTGSFRLDRVPASMTVDLLADHPDYIGHHGALLQWKESGRYEPGVHDATLTLEPPATLIGKVISQATGRPVPHCLVIAEGRLESTEQGCYWSVLSDADGEFQLDVLPSRVQIKLGPQVFGEVQHISLTARADNVLHVPYAADTPRLILGAGDPNRINHTWHLGEKEVHARADESVEVTLEAIQLAQLTLVLLDTESQRPVKSAYVTLQRSRDNRIYHRDTFGYQPLRYSLPAGHYTIKQLMPSKYLPLDKLPEIELSPGENREIVLKVKTITRYTIHAVDGSGDPIVGATAFISNAPLTDYPGDGTGTIEIPPDPVSQAHAAHRDDRERKVMRPHIYVIDKQGGRAGIELLSESPGIVRVRLTDAYEAAGRVVDGDGRGIPDCVVHLMLLEDPYAEKSRVAIIAETLSDRDGNYHIAGIPGRITFRVMAWRDDLGNAMVQGRAVNVKFPDGLIELNDLQLHSLGEPLAGRIVTAWGQPAPHVTVSLSGLEQPDPLPVRTGIDGSFRFEGLSPGEVILTLAMDPDAPTRCGSREVETQVGDESVAIMLACFYPEPENSVSLPEGWGTIKVHVIDAHTSEPLDATVTCKIGGFTHNPDYQTDSGGVATIFHPAGELDGLFIRKYGYRWLSPEEPVEVRSGETQHVTFKLVSHPRMTGTVVDPDGLPVGGAILVLLPRQFVMKTDMFRVVTGADGRFDFQWNYKMALREAKELKSMAGNKDELRLPIYLMAYQLRRNLSAVYEIEQPTYPDWELELLDSPRLSGQYFGPSGEGTKATLHDMQVVWPHTPRHGRRPSYHRCFTIEPAVEENGRHDFTNGYNVDTDGDGYFDDIGLPILAPEFSYRITFQPKRGGRSEVIVTYDDLVAGKALQVNLAK
jgi:uncharacterized cupredoxin-like copper-binding protein